MGKQHNLSKTNVQTTYLRLFFRMLLSLKNHRGLQNLAKERGVICHSSAAYLASLRTTAPVRGRAAIAVYFWRFVNWLRRVSSRLVFPTHSIKTSITLSLLVECLFQTTLTSKRLSQRLRIGPLMTLWSMPLIGPSKLLML